jgi:hypothetical protein
MLIPRAGDASSAGTRWHKMAKCKHGETAWGSNTGDIAVQCSLRRQDTFCAVIESLSTACWSGYTACSHLQASPVSCHVTRPQMRASSASHDGQRPLVNRARSQFSEPSASPPFAPLAPLALSRHLSHILCWRTRRAPDLWIDALLGRQTNLGIVPPHPPTP